QIAGDLMPAKSDSQWAENLVATTFLAMGAKNVNEQQGAQFAADLVDEQIDVMSRVFLGTSIACARCHDHKFDPIRQTDYYALAGIFGSTKTYFGNPPSQYGSLSPIQARRTSSLLLLPVEDPNPFDPRYTQAEMDQMRSQIDDGYGQLGGIRRGGSAGSSSNSSKPGANPQQQFIRIRSQMAAVSAKLAVVDQDGNPRSYCMGVQDESVPADARLLVRGEIDQIGQRVPRGIPHVFTDVPLDIPSGKSGRMELANWLSSDHNPLTPRVIVNRVWQQLMGTGIVSTPDDFGWTGQQPSHPELLDRLTVDFVASGWSIKSLVRQIAGSRIYRVSSTHRDDYHQLDSDNRWVWRANPKRLDAESIRDAMLAVAGELDESRPRASLVAQAGYVRVRDGRLGLETQLRKTVDSIRKRYGRSSGEGSQGMMGLGSYDPRRIREMVRNRSGDPQARREMFTALQSLRESANKNTLDAADARYRSVYLPIVRDNLPRSMDVFDFPDASLIAGKREASNTANQALYLLNNEFVVKQSESFASRVSRDASSNLDRLDQAYLMTLARYPTSSEKAAIGRYGATLARSGETAQLWPTICQSLFALAEFRYLD
ncbi:MAG: DUF1553 domain-containing protein, partial [Planctomycetota bacterium]